MKVSSVSPERWLTITPQPFCWAILHLQRATRFSLKVPKFYMDDAIPTIQDSFHFLLPSSLLCISGATNEVIIRVLWLALACSIISAVTRLKLGWEIWARLLGFPWNETCWEDLIALTVTYSNQEHKYMYAEEREKPIEPGHESLSYLLKPKNNFIYFAVPIKWSW